MRLVLALLAILTTAGCNQVLGIPEPSRGDGDARAVDARDVDAIDAPVEACGDNMHGSQPCDGTDLDGHTCAGEGFPPGGVLTCNPTCTGFVVTGCTAPAAAPTLRRPMNGAYLGSPFVAGSRRPTFAWTAVTWTGTGALDYRLDYATDPAFPTATTTTTTVAATTSQPASDLAISMTAPVGARYYWRVRACYLGVCSPASPTWHVDVGRSEHDVNGDGYADVVGGAPDYYTAGGTGKAIVYLGGPGAFDTTADATIAGTVAGGHLGNAVALGDVNGDGFADVVVAASGQGAVLGRVYVLLGSATFDTTADGTLTGAAIDDGFGSSVAAAGDVNGDGYADLVVGAPLNDDTAADAGRVYVYFGGAGMAFDSSADAAMAGAAADDWFGHSVGGGGDVNGDGFADVVVGAWLADTPAANAGRAYVYLGGPNGLDGTADGTLSGAAAGDNLGVSVASAGDVNGDGFSDVVVGAYSADAGGNDRGRAYVYFGAAGTSFDATADGTVSGAADTNYFGGGVSSAGDVNGDGFADVVIGAYGANGQNGAAYVYLGASGGVFDTTTDGVLASPVAGAQFGWRVASAGDTNGDGRADVVVGAPVSAGGGSNAGQVFVYDGVAGAVFDNTPDGAPHGSPGTTLGISVD